MEAESVKRLVWRLRPFSGTGHWLVFETTGTLLDWLTAYGRINASYEVQLVPMTPEELEQIPVRR